MKHFKDCNNILCIRADNMGDVLMSSPAINAVKNTINSKITLLTSTKGALITSLLPAIDEVIEFNLPWVKIDGNDTSESLTALISELKSRAFDGCIIFTVYSQNPMPAIMLAYLADIPLRLAYCRENPYQLLTHWVADPEPYELIRHQVERDLALVAHIGAVTEDRHIRLALPSALSFNNLWAARQLPGPEQAYLVLHPGVSEAKRTYTFDNWVACGKMLADELALPLLITGSAEEKPLTDKMALAIGPMARSLGGALKIEEFTLLISRATAVICVNTSAAHLAAAFGTPVVVLYAMTNPQHTPWMVPCKVLPYHVAEKYRSKNKIVEHVAGIYKMPLPQPAPATVFEAVCSLLDSEK